MKKDMIDIVCCPSCKGDLVLQVEKEIKSEIITGFFSCNKCKCNYPIEDGIPNLLPRE